MPEILVDEEDLDLLASYSWKANKEGYVQAHVNRRNQFLHRAIMGYPDSKVDHINGNPSDCRRSNLRLATTSQNAMNMKKRTGSISEYKGVMWEKDRNKWVARIKAEGVYKNLGRFDTEQEAAKAYDEAAQLYFGDFAYVHRGL